MNRTNNPGMAPYDLAQLLERAWRIADESPATLRGLAAHVGVTTRTLRRWRAGVNPPTVQQCLKIGEWIRSQQ